ncbi:hypothetical protein Plhal710r2_c081g0180271 [Plasmopara halstedii]
MIEFCIIRAKSEELANAIRDLPNVSIPGYSAEKHYYWLFPVCVPCPKNIVIYMNKHVRLGFDVTSGATQLTYVPRYDRKSHRMTLFDLMIRCIVHLDKIMILCTLKHYDKVSFITKQIIDKVTDNNIVMYCKFGVSSYHPETPDWAIHKMINCFRDALNLSSRL